MTRSALLVLLALLVPLQAQEPTSRPSSQPTPQPTSQISLEDLPEPEDIFPEDPEEFEMKPGEVRVFRYTPEVEGEASIWMRSRSDGATLEIRSLDGKVVHRLTGTSCQVFLKVVSEQCLTLVVGSGPGGVSQTVAVTLAVVEVEGTQDLESGVDSLRSATAEVARLRDASDMEGARAAAKRAWPNIRNIPGPWPSDFVKAVLRLAEALRPTGDLETYGRLTAAILSVHRMTLPEEHRDLQTSRERQAIVLDRRGDIGSAMALQHRVLSIRQRTLPKDHPLTLTSRQNYARLLAVSGDLAEAKRLFRQVLEARERSLDEDDLVLMKTRANYAGILAETGDLGAARDLMARVVATSERVLPEVHLDLQRSRHNQATLHFMLGELDEALKLQEVVVHRRAQLLPDDHSDLLKSRISYAATLSALRRFEKAKSVGEQILSVMQKKYERAHPFLLTLRDNHAGTLLALGYLERARRIQREILEVREKILPDDHPHLRSSRFNYAATLKALGDLAGAKALEEKVLDGDERSLPESNPNLQRTRQAYAATLFALGDRAAAKALLERVIAAQERNLPPGNPDHLVMRVDYAAYLRALGDYRGAKRLIEQALADRGTDVREDDVDQLRIHGLYGAVLAALGEVERAKVIHARVVEGFERRFAADHPELLAARANLATVLLESGDLEEARRLFEEVLANQTLPEGHDDRQIGNRNYAITLRALAAHDPSVGPILERHLIETLESSHGFGWRLTAILAPRQVAAAVARRRVLLGLALSLADDRRSPDILRHAFRLCAELRAASRRSRLLLRATTAGDDELNARVEARRADLHRRTQEVDGFLSNPTAGEAGIETVSARLAQLMRSKEEAERMLLETLRATPAGSRVLRSVAPEEIAKALPPGAIAASYFRYERTTVERKDAAAPVIESSDYLAAFILTKAEEILLVELGPMAPVAALIERWRGFLGGGRSHDDERFRRTGTALHQKLLEPVIRAADDGVVRLVVVPCEEMQVLPLDALPSGEGGDRVGDQLLIDVVSGLEWVARHSSSDLNPHHLVAIGGIDFGSAPKASDIKQHSSAAFASLPASRAEIETIARLFRKTFDQAHTPAVLAGRHAGHRSLRTSSPAARYLHIATHGWFAPESVPSLRDHTPELERLGIDGGDFRQAVTGYEPLALCGLALTDANLPRDGDGIRPGVLTGNEIATMDLSGVELAVLSACDTNVGVRRAGQGIMSLQEALFSAGVRYTITSLWKVPDEATMELMTRFYEGIWRRSETKREALWNAKLKLRRMKDPTTGKPKYGLRDWAGWVLVGNPE